MLLLFREVDRERFEEVKSGLKTIETRAGTKKYQHLNAGDELTFKCGKDVFTKKVIKKYHWPTIDAMFSEIPLKKVMPDLDTVEQAKARYESYPNYVEKIGKDGILGFELA